MNRRGAAMVWAVVSVLLVFILAVGLLGLSSSSAKRSLNSNMERQAYLTARSAVDAVLAELDEFTVTVEEGETLDYGSPLIPALGGAVNLTEFEWPTEAGDSMGRCTGTIERPGNGSKLYVEVTATVGDRSETVRAVLGLTVHIAGALTDEAFNGFCFPQLQLSGQLQLSTRTMNMTIFDRDNENDSGEEIGTVTIGSISAGEMQWNGAGGQQATITIEGDLYSDLVLNPLNLGGLEAHVDVIHSSGNQHEYPESMFAPPGEISLNATRYITLDECVQGDNANLHNASTGENGSSFFLFAQTLPGDIAEDPNITVDGDLSSSGEWTGKLTVDDNRPYFIRVGEGCTLEMTLQSPDIGTPEVYLFLESGAKVGLESVGTMADHVGVYLYIYGGTGTEVAVVGKRGNMDIYGAIFVDTFRFNSMNDERYLTLNYAKPTYAGLNAVLKTDSTRVTTYTWNLEKYER